MPREKAMINFSQLLWGPQPSKEEATPELPQEDSANADTPTGAWRPPVEEVQVEAASRVFLLSEPHGAGADRFRYIRMRLRELKATVNLKSLAVTSALPRDGKSTIALNLATALAEGGKRDVLLIEADLHHPTIAETLQLPPRPGLAESLEDALDPLTAIRRIEPLGWHLLQAGNAKDNPSELLQLNSLTAVMQRLEPLFDWIVVDTPPVVPLTDALSIAKRVDACVLVARANSTPQELVEDAVTLIGPKRVLGIILNGTEDLRRLYSKYYRYYGKK